MGSSLKEERRENILIRKYIRAYLNENIFAGMKKHLQSEPPAELAAIQQNIDSVTGMLQQQSSASGATLSAVVSALDAPQASIRIKSSVKDASEQFRNAMNNFSNGIAGSLSGVSVGKNGFLKDDTKLKEVEGLRKAIAIEALRTLIFMELAKLGT